MEKNKSKTQKVLSWKESLFVVERIEWTPDECWYKCVVAQKCDSFDLDKKVEKIKVNYEKLDEVYIKTELTGD